MISNTIGFAVGHTAAGPALTVTTQRGGALARTGVGVHTFTLDEACDAAECQVKLEARHATGIMGEVIHTSDTVKTISWFTHAGAAVDPTDFSIVVTKHAAGGF